MLKNLGGKWCQPAPSFSERYHSECCQLGNCSENSDKSLYYVPQMLFRSLHAAWPWVIFLPSLQKQSSDLQVLFQAQPLNFQAPGLRSCWLQELAKFSHSFFFFLPNQWLWGNIFLVRSHLLHSVLPFSRTMTPSPLQQLWSGSSITLIFALVTFFDVAFSFLLWRVFFFLSLLMWFLEYLGWFGSYIVVFMVCGETKILLVFHHFLS